MKIESFEDLLVWQKAMDLAEQVYRVTSSGLLSKDFGLKDQLQRAVVSIPANIAEGFERKSTREFQQFLNIAKGSCGELRCLIILANRIGYLDKNQNFSLCRQSIEISKMLSGLLRSLNGRGQNS